MHFYIDSKELTASVLSVIKALPVRTSLNCLEGIYVNAASDGLHFMCSDLMLQKECIVKADIKEEGKAIIPGKVFAEFVRKIPDGEAEITINGSNINIQCGRLNTTLQTLVYEEFPEMIFEGNDYKIKIDKDECKEMINQTVFATAQDDSKPILTGVYLEINKDSFTAVATDAYQFAMRNVKIKNDSDEVHKAIIPSKAMIEISHILDEAEDEIEFAFTRTHIMVNTQKTCLTARLLDGNYIDFRRIIPSEYATRVIVNRSEMMDSIDRAHLVAREGTNNIKLKFENKRVLIHSDSHIGKFEEEIDAQSNGEEIEIAFNAKYCMNVLKSINDEKICIDLLSSISPCVLRPLTGDKYYYLIVPVRIYTQM